MTFDDQLRGALDQMLAGLREHLEADLRAFAEQVSRAAAADRETSAAQAREAAAALARAEMADHLERAREEAVAHAKQVQDAADARLAELQQQAEGRIGDLLRSVERLRSEIEDLNVALGMARKQADEAQQQATHARTEAQANAEEVLVTQLAAADAEHRRRLEDTVATLQAERTTLELTQATRLREAVRGLDATRTLGEVLDVLTHSAAREVERAAVLLVRGDRLQGWRFAGFTPPIVRPATMSLTLDEAGIVGTTVRHSTAAMHAASDGSANAAVALPAFALGAGGRHAVSLPVTVGGTVVAALYADAPYTDDGLAGRWSALLEVFTRHASRVLETTTLQQAAGVAPGPVGRASGPASGGVQ